MSDLWHPSAIRVSPPFESRGRYPGGWPRGAVVHTTGGSTPQGAIETARSGGLGFLVLDRMGRLYQGMPLDCVGAHAGRSEWPGLGKSVSSSLIGIECVCDGMVEPMHEDRTDRMGVVHRRPNGMYRSWYGRTLESPDVRYVPQSEGSAHGFYHKLTMTQEEELEALLVWLYMHAPSRGHFDPAFVLGHSEVAVPAGRKTDPGGSLGWTMDELRTRLTAAIWLEEGRR